MKKSIVGLFLIFEIISCKNQKEVKNSGIQADNLNTTVNVYNSASHLYSHTESSLERPIKVISFGPWPKIDTLVTNYHIQYQVQDNDERFLQETVGDDNDTLYYYSGREIVLDIKHSNNLLFHKKINRELFHTYIPQKEFSKYSVHNMWINRVDSGGIFLDLSVCIPDTDVSYDFELHITLNGKLSIKEVIYEEEDF